MSDDLISRKSVIDILESIRLNDRNLVRRYAAADIEERVENLPTAYDVDEVCKEIKDLKMMYFLTIANTGEEKMDYAYEKVSDALDKTIEIVRNGGKKE